MSPEQGALTLTRQCRECGADIPWDGGPGRPRVLCDGCRPSEWAPIRGRRINQSSRSVSAPASRHTDPPTSAAAAASITPGAIEARILEAFDAFAWLTPFEIVEVLNASDREDTVRSAVSRLRKAGVLVDTGTRRPSPRGRASMVLRKATSA